MRTQITLLTALLCVCLASPTQANVACEKAYKDLKHREALQRHLQNLDIDRLLMTGTPARPCSKERIQFEENYATRAKEMAPVAKAFVRACGRVGDHMAELELYSNDRVLQPAPSTGRDGCGVAEYNARESMAPGTIAR